MTRLLAFLLSGCWHHWEVINTEGIYWSDGFGRGECVRYTLQCKRCGEIKNKRAK